MLNNLRYSSGFARCTNVPIATGDGTSTASVPLIDSQGNTFRKVKQLDGLVVDSWFGTGIPMSPNLRTDYLPAKRNLLVWTVGGGGSQSTVATITTEPSTGLFPGTAEMANMFKILETTLNIDRSLFSPPYVLPSGITATWYIVVKGGLGRDWVMLIPGSANPGEAGALFNITTGQTGFNQPNLSAFGMRSLGNDWWLCWITRTTNGDSSDTFRMSPSTDNSDNIAYAGDVTKGFYYFTGGIVEGTIDNLGYYIHAQSDTGPSQQTDYILNGGRVTLCSPNEQLDIGDVVKWSGIGAR